jgi:uncharacterized membrane protein YdfJ with MMPL/SSD domain
VEALDDVWRSARMDVTVPALVLAAGFLALTVSDFTAFQDFGIVGLAGLALELAGLTLVLPATLLVAEQGISVRVPRSPREAAALLRDAGRRARVGLAGAGRAAAAGVRRAAPSRK